MKLTMTRNYRKFSRVQGGALEKALQSHEPVLSKHLSSLSNPILSMADFGCASGENSLPIVHFVQKGIRRFANLQLFSCDLADNDWNQLFKLHQSTNYFHYAVAGSFYDQLFPPNYLDFSFSGSAFHWMNVNDRLYKAIREKKPQFSACAFLDSFPQELRSEVQEKVQHDWKTVIDQRLTELQKDGIMMMVLLCRPKDERTRYMVQDLFDIALSEADLTQEERGNCFVPVFFRSPAEYLSLQGAQVIDMKEFTIKNPFSELLEQQRTVEFSKLMAENTRVWTSTSFLNCLDPTRTEEEVRDLHSMFYNKFAELIQREAHEIVHDHTRYISIVIQKK